MAFDTTDIIDQEAVRSQVEAITQEDLVFREAFRQITTAGTANDTIKIPVVNDELSRPETIEEGGEYPYDEEGYSTVAISREKIGQMVPITDEAEMDNIFDVVADMTERQARKLAEELDRRAHDVLSSNLNATTAGDNGDTLAWTEVVEGRRILQDAGYDPDLLIIDPNGWEDLLNDSEFNRATGVGDQMATDGELPSVAGLDAVVSNHDGTIGDHDAYLVDTSYYGYEATWQAADTETFREEKHDTEFLKIRTFRGWTAVDSDAAVHVQG